MYTYIVCIFIATTRHSHLDVSHVAYTTPRPTHIDRLPGPQPPVTNRSQAANGPTANAVRSTLVTFRLPPVSASRPSDSVRLLTVSASRPCPPPSRPCPPPDRVRPPPDRVRLPTVSASRPCPPPNRVRLPSVSA